MKNYIKIISIALVFFSSVACEDYLEPIPYSFTSPENFYKTNRDAEIALNGVYNTLSANSIQGFGNQSSFSRNIFEMLNGATDECGVTPNVIVRVTPWGNASFISQDPLVNESWFFMYAGINRANILLEKLPTIPDEYFSGNRKTEIEAEARLLRGFFHMITSMMHGAIPVYTSTSQSPTKGRQPVSEVYEQIISDYQNAYNKLPNRAGIKGHVDKWTAAGLLVKVYTYLASMRSNGLSDFGYSRNSFDWVNATLCYNLALTISTDIINNSGYRLTANYDYLFRETTKSAQYEEFMFAAEASGDASQFVINVIQPTLVPVGQIAVTGGGTGWYRPFAELYFKYNARDLRRGRNITGTLGGVTTTLQVATIDGVRYYEPRTIANPLTGNMCIGKFRLKDPAQKSTEPFASNMSMPLLRFADILLLHAEALYFTGNEVGARAVLTSIRQRAVLAPAVVGELNTAYFKADFVQELLDERSRELCFEMWRRIDLARFNKYDNVINALNPSTSYGAYNAIASLIKQNWRSEKVWFPLPQPQLDVNPNLDQNPGY